MNDQHTPGPWSADRAEAEANARLLAAAHDLLAACVALRAVMRSIVDSHGGEFEEQTARAYHDLLDRAIRRAIDV